jgi:hypothetical protein
MPGQLFAYVYLRTRPRQLPVRDEARRIRPTLPSCHGVIMPPETMNGL